MYVRDVLVPTDFSPNSLGAVEAGAALVEAGGEICLLHVVDAEFVRHLVDEDFGEPEGLVNRLRDRAQQQMDAMVEGLAAKGLNLRPLVAVGRPVEEILKLSEDMDFSMIVLARHGRRGGETDQILFGSVAEKVIRGARVPVLCVPSYRRERNQPQPSEVVVDQPVANPDPPLHPK